MDYKSQFIVWALWRPFGEDDSLLPAPQHHPAQPVGQVGAGVDADAVVPYLGRLARAVAVNDDGLMARLVAQAGFRAPYMTGAGTAISYGLPDYGLLTITEMYANAARIAPPADVAVIADADTRSGNRLYVTRTVRQFLLAAVTAIHL